MIRIIKKIKLPYWVLYTLMASSVAPSLYAQKIFLTAPDSPNPILTIQLKDTLLQWEFETIKKQKKLPEGIFSISKKRSSTAGSFPVISYSCYCETNEFDQDFFIKIVQSSITTNISLFDNKSQKLLSSSIQTSEIFNPPTTQQFELQDSLLILKDDSSITYPLSQILSRGTWSIIPQESYLDYDGVLLWECKPEITNGEYCYCDSSIDPDILLDNPTCVNYTRRAKIAFKVSQKNLIYLPISSDILEKEDFKINKVHILIHLKDGDL
jgi:hypothetical protein